VRLGLAKALTTRVASKGQFGQDFEFKGADELGDVKRAVMSMINTGTKEVSQKMVSDLFGENGLSHFTKNAEFFSWVDNSDSSVLFGM
jgi:hypothetical protein